MQNETAKINGGCCPSVSDDAGAGPEGRPSVPNGKAVKSHLPDDRRATDDVLLAYCDGHFAELMQRSQVNGSGGLVKTISEADIQRQAREDYLHSQVAGKAVLVSTKRRIVTARSSLERGLGPRLFVGFDAEWEHVRKGRNQILSVQFFVITPNGETLKHVIHIVGGQAVEERPSLSQAIYDLIEMCIDEAIVEDWPCEVVLCGFFTRADITVFRDFKKLRPQLDGVNGTLVTVGESAKVELPIATTREMQLKSRYQSVVGDTFDPKLLSVRLVDASRLAPPGKSLEDLGAWLGVPKVKLPEGQSKSNMRKFQREDRAGFEAYGIRDAEIAVVYVLWAVWFSNRHLGLDMRHLSATASGLAVRLAESCIRQDGVALDVAFNYEKKSVTRWNDATGLPRVQKKRMPKRIRRWLEPFLADVYIGGRNECFVFGPSERKLIDDPDLTTAYLSGLGYLFVLNYEKAFKTERLADYFGHVAGFALVKFRFPSGTARPCLPVATEDRGLLFPLSGESLCTAPEIELAHQMGAELEIVYGYVIPWMPRAEVFARSQALPGRHYKSGKAKSETAGVMTGVIEVNDAHRDAGVQANPAGLDDVGYRTFQSFGAFIRENRNRYTRKTLPFEFIKLLGNALYGKTGQGFRHKRAFDPSSMGSVVVGPSRISDAAVAGLVCGFIRATLSEILWKLPADATLISATTDGFLVDTPLDQVDLTGTMCQRFQALVDRLSPGERMLENKHRVMQIFAGRTRLQVTIEGEPGYPTVTAKGGVKPGPDVVDENAFMTDLILNRVPGQKIAYESFITMRDQLSLNLDLQMETRETTLNLEYDFKRAPDASTVRMVEVSGWGVSHVAFNTRPWQTADEGVLNRLIFDKWRATHCLKTVEDFEDWEGYRLFRLENMKRRNVVGVSGDVPESSRNSTGRRNLTKAGYVGVVKRVFLAAYQRRVWGLAGVGLSQAKLAAWLTECGYPTTLSAVKNGTNDEVQECVVPMTAEVQALLNVLKEGFPDLEVDRFLIKSS